MYRKTRSNAEGAMKERGYGQENLHTGHERARTRKNLMYKMQAKMKQKLKTLIWVRHQTDIM